MNTGKRFEVEKLSVDALQAGQLGSSWIPNVDHPGLTPEAGNFMSRITASVLLNLSAGGLNVSDEWNVLLPDHQFTGADDFLRGIWTSKA